MRVPFVPQIRHKLGRLLLILSFLPYFRPSCGALRQSVIYIWRPQWRRGVCPRQVEFVEVARISTTCIWYGIYLPRDQTICAERFGEQFSICTPWLPWQRGSGTLMELWESISKNLIYSLFCHLGHDQMNLVQKTSNVNAPPRNVIHNLTYSYRNSERARATRRKGDD